MAHAGDGHLALLHRLEQRRLGACGGVRLISSARITCAKIGPGTKRTTRWPVARSSSITSVPSDVGRHQVGRELDAAETQVERPRQRLHEQRLGQPGHALQQAVAAGQKHQQHLLYDLGLADDHPPHGLVDARDEGLGFVDGHRLLGSHFVSRPHDPKNRITTPAPCWRSRRQEFAGELFVVGQLFRAARGQS